MLRRSLLLPAAVAVLAQAQVQGQQPNVLLIVADDLGNDRVGAYAEHPDPGHTPNIDALAAQGLLFRNAWACPLCSPTRATILTGRYGFRTGVGANILANGDAPELDLEETTLPEVLSGYTSVALGKWHLGRDLLHPNDSGFAHFAGTLHNLDRIGDDPPSYFQWTKVVDGVESVSTTYATTDTADDAIAAFQSLPQPWFVYCCFHAPHDPFHAPPPELHNYDLQGDPEDDVPLFVRAAIEAMDTEIGRMLSFLPSDTVVIFVGDNGTEDKAVDPPTVSGRNKGTPYEGGVNVPLIVKGPGVVPGECAALVDATDLFATLVELAGASHPTEDSISLVPYFADPARPSLREWVYAETFGPHPFRRAYRGERYKLIRQRSPGNESEELYDLLADPLETTDLLVAGMDEEAQAAYEQMGCAMPPFLEPLEDCPQAPNSTGQPGRLTARGSTVLAFDALCLEAQDLPPNRPVRLLAGQGSLPILQIGSPGVFCLGGRALAGYPLHSTGQYGGLQQKVDVDALPFDPPRAILVGQTWRFQVWFREAPGLGQAGFTNVAELTFE